MKQKQIYTLITGIIGLLIVQIPLMAAAQQSYVTVGSTFDDNSAYYKVTSLNSNTVEIFGWVYDGLKYSVPSSVVYNEKEYLVTGVNLWPSGYYNIGEGLFHLPDSIKNIGYRCFYDSRITGINLPNGLTFINSEAFGNTAKLKEIKLPESLESMGADVFNGSAINNISIPRSCKLEEIREGTFANCNSLSTIVLPSKVATTGKNAFLNCTNLSEITFSESFGLVRGTPFENCPNLKKIVFLSPEPPSIGTMFGAPETVTIYVPAESVDKYKAVGNFGFHYDIKSITYASSINLNTNELSLHDPNGGYYAQAQLYAEILPKETTVSSLYWSSDNEDIATVDANGVVTAKGYGETYVTATTLDGSNLSAACKITVAPRLITAIKFEKSAITTEKSKSYYNQGLLISREGDAENEYSSFSDISDFYSIEWSSDNENVATVWNGSVTLKGIGSATISVTITNKNSGEAFSASYTINVINKFVNSVIINESSKPELTLEKNSIGQLIARAYPLDADDRTVTWMSDNEEVATVDGNGLVTAVGEGKATITATANDGSGVSASCVVTVTFIDGIAAIEAGKVTVLAANGRITVSGKEPDDTVSVYDTGGRLLYQGEDDVIDVPRKAMYIVTVSGKSYKVVVQ